MSKNPLLQTLIAMTGQDNVITVHRPFVQFTGTLEAAMMLSQLLYWTPRTSIPGGWIAKSDKDWKKELCLARYSHRAATARLLEMGVIETIVKKFNGAPTTHYRVKWESLESKWVSWLGSSEIERTESLKSDVSSSETEPSLTETTAETTEIDSKIFTALTELTGGLLNTSAPRFVDTWKEKHPLEKIMQAIDVAKSKGRKPIEYVDSILIGWEANGYPKSRDEQVKERQAGKKTPTPSVADNWLARKERELANGNA